MQDHTQPNSKQNLKEGDLLKWQDIELSLHGEVSSNTIDKDNLLSKKTTFVFVNTSFTTLDKCMQH